MSFLGGGAAANSAPVSNQPQIFFLIDQYINKIYNINTKLEVNMKKAFTLSEVLITLGVIGIVAAMTLPAVINNSRNKQLEAGLKRSYSVLGQALNMYQAETGERVLPEKEIILNDILKKYLNVIDDCGNFRNPEGVAVHSKCLQLGSENTVYRTYSGELITSIGYFDDGQFVLNDGSLVLVENPVHLNRMYISVDVNGLNKNPNRFGHDLFMFQIDKKGMLLPMGVKGTDYTDEAKYCSVSSNEQYNGAGCTYKALTDKDYFKNLPKK